MPRAIVALGSNLGCRAATIRSALSHLRQRFELEATASLYESSAAYIEQQPPFLNTVCALHADCSPAQLLQSLKDIERELGRVPSHRWGPRAIDLDLVLYGEHVLEEEPNAPLPLTLPHPRMAERRFVLEPLAELDPNALNPLLNRTAADLLASLPSDGDAASPLQRVCPLGSDDDAGLVRWGERTLLMGVLNVTPDSFSDGGDFLSPDSAVKRALELQDAGADILDVGAVSTRPGASIVTPDEEFRRAAPVIAALATSPQLRVPLSIDTTSAFVAREIVGLGARIVNDISAGLHDPQMLPTIADLGVPAVLMHTRGSPETMTSLAIYSDVVSEVRFELSERLRAAQAAGIPKWDIIVDPGIGFAKTTTHNLDLLAKACSFGLSNGGMGYPMLLGVSRKSFIGQLLGGVPPKARGWGTAAASVACMPHCDILRVHDVAEMKQVATVADAILRRGHAASSDAPR
eukprot:scaffold91357_cov36-Tisochrysis_lutea.AAC.1